MELANAFREVNQAGNDYMLGASKQGGFLAAAVIASSSLWSPNETIGLHTKLAIALLGTSILLSTAIHFALGLLTLNKLKKYVPVLEGRASLGSIQDDDFTSWGSLRSPMWICGWGQIASLMTGLLLVLYLLIVSS